MLKIKNFSSRTIVISLLVVLLGAGGFFIYTRKDTSELNPDVTEGISFSPATENDKQRVDETKQRIVEKDSQPTQQQESRQEVKPLITYAGQYDQAVEVGGYVSGIFEDSGLCTATFSRTGSSFKKSVQAVKNASSVDCPVISVSSDDFNTKGSWNVVLSYESRAAFGSSDPRQIEVK